MTDKTRAASSRTEEAPVSPSGQTDGRSTASAAGAGWNVPKVLREQASLRPLPTGAANDGPVADGSVTERPKARLPRILSVISRRQLSPHMLRVTLGGEGLRNFPEGQEGAHVKLLIPEPDIDPAGFLSQIEQGQRPVTRTYTIRHHRPDLREIDIDFALHGQDQGKEESPEGEGSGGPASNWAQRAIPGDFIGLFGPGPKKMTFLNADWFLLAADMTAIPAAAAALEEIPRDAVGTAVFEITSEDDRQEIDAPEGIDIHWLVNPTPEKPSKEQSRFIRAIRWRPGRPSIFVAGEASVVKELRVHLLQERGIPREDSYVSAYWKIGVNEDTHQKIKRATAD
ncbi:siderophore-interacting protein [Kiloniella laminariae]|uniref:Siderophore-interacting protein n=1 Tax=Kiloniella laminariae TaxID=454162 RepID=A0ABT4LEX3_9PROT|nr:siderophore-interacting protein [Kiloniella laminariae]MCZ4279644.1 siderophore-interacting protein [Kiloniella laminariae]